MLYPVYIWICDKFLNLFNLKNLIIYLILSPAEYIQIRCGALLLLFEGESNIYWFPSEIDYFQQICNFDIPHQHHHLLTCLCTLLATWGRKSYFWAISEEICRILIVFLWNNISFQEGQNHENRRVVNLVYEEVS